LFIPSQVTGVKKLREASLKVGDIILTTSTHAVSKAIRTATGSDISHAMLYVQDHSVIDATADGVQAGNTQRYFFEDDCSIYVLRLRAPIPADQIRAVCNFVRGQLGTQYSTKEAVRAAFGGARKWTRKQFCSRLVAQAYASVGVELVENPNYCSPAELKESPMLVEVSDATIAVSAKEAAFWEAQANLPRLMREATNSVLDGARKKNKEIQNFDDIDSHLAAHPDDDAYFCDLLEKFDYLTLWQVEKAKNPWQYDIDLMKVFSRLDAGIEEYCRSIISGEDDGPNRFVVNHGGYALLSKQFGQRYFTIMMELHGVLAELHRKRVEVATAWLQAYGLLSATEASPLRPHTREWFDALEIWNPPQAMMTRAAIAAAGKPDVCSICGDDPALDYRLEKNHRPPGGVDTFRLCDDCLKIRRELGEPFIALDMTEPP